MKSNEVKEMKLDELYETVITLKKELFNLRFQHATNQLENPMRIKAVKKDIARCKTIIREKEMAAVSS